MSYAGERTIHDADSHVMEWPEWLLDHADPDVRPRMAPLFVASVKPGEDSFIEQQRRQSGPCCGSQTNHRAA